MSQQTSNTALIVTPPTAYVETYDVTDPTTGNAVIFAQRYAADKDPIGDPIQVTSNQLVSTPLSTLLLSNGGFVVFYNSYYPDPSIAYPTPYLTTTQIAPDGADVADNSVTYNNGYTYNPQYQAITLSNGAYAYILTDYVAREDASSNTLTLSYANAAGQGFTKQLASWGFDGNEPYPQYFLGPATIQHFANDTFSVTWTASYTPASPEYPPPTPAPSGTQYYDDVYSDDGTLETTLFVDFDGARTVDVFAPSGAEIRETYIHDGLTEVKQFDIVGEPYASQDAVYTAAGNLISLVREYASGVTELTETVNADGSSELYEYDTSGRETTNISYAADGSRDVFLWTYQGADSTPETVGQYHYGAGNQMLWSDVTAANGSHTQTADAPDVVLTSHTGVSDAFVSSQAGSDTFVFQPGFGQDVISRFHAGPGAGHDTIEFDSSIVADFAHLQPLIGGSGGDNALIKVDPTDTILLKGVSSSSLTSADFAFVPMT